MNRFAAIASLIAASAFTGSAHTENQRQVEKAHAPHAPAAHSQTPRK